MVTVPARSPTPGVAIRVAAVTAVIVLLVAAGAAYLALGWQRMEAACARDDTGPPGWTAVSFAWSWWPVGFECTWTAPSGETDRTSLWW